MFENLKRLYTQGKLDTAALTKAIGKGWISQEQFSEIVGG